eukprot:scaffold20531_cov67-Cyclotella_meneghiniana.AAC.3
MSEATETHTQHEQLKVRRRRLYAAASCGVVRCCQYHMDCDLIGATLHHIMLTNLIHIWILKLLNVDCRSSWRSEEIVMSSLK